MSFVRRMMGVALAIGASVFAGTVEAEEIAAFYRATWAGLPAAEIRLGLGDRTSDYRHQIRIETLGLPRFMTKFSADAVGEGRLSKDEAEPARYDARYDLRKRRDRHLSLRFVRQEGATIAERTAEDTSRK